MRIEKSDIYIYVYLAKATSGFSRFTVHNRLQIYSWYKMLLKNVTVILCSLDLKQD